MTENSAEHPSLQEVEIDGTPLEVLLQQAADLKTHEMSRERRHFDALPVFLRNSLFLQDDELLDVRESTDFAKKLSFCLACKESGNALFREGDVLRAKRDFERALSVWMYVRSDFDDWRKRPIEDKDLRHFRYEPRSEEERASVNETRHKLLLNLSLCYQQLYEYAHSRQCCDAILRELDAHCVKALYRRAQSLLLPLSCSASDADAALKDLQTALEVDPGNAAVRALFVKTRGERERQRETERRRYGGFLDRAMSKESAERRGVKETETESENETRKRFDNTSSTHALTEEESLSRTQLREIPAEPSNARQTSSPRLSLGDLFHALNSLESEIESLRVALTHRGERDSDDDERALLAQRLSAATQRKHTIEESLRAANLDVETLRKDFEQLKKAKAKQSDFNSSAADSSPKVVSLSPEDWDVSVVREGEAIADKLFDDCDPHTLRKMLRSRWRREQRRLFTEAHSSGARKRAECDVEIKIREEREPRGLQRVRDVKHIDAMPKSILDEVLRECVVRDYLHCCVLWECRYPSESEKEGDKDGDRSRRRERRSEEETAAAEKKDKEGGEAAPEEEDGDEKERREFFQSLLTERVLQYLQEEPLFSLVALPESLAFLEPLLTHTLSWLSRALTYMETALGVDKSSARVFFVSFFALCLFRVVLSALAQHNLFSGLMSAPALAR